MWRCPPFCLTTWPSCSIPLDPRELPRGSWSLTRISASVPFHRLFVMLSKFFWAEPLRDHASVYRCTTSLGERHTWTENGPVKLRRSDAAHCTPKTPRFRSLTFLLCRQAPATGPTDSFHSFHWPPRLLTLLINSLWPFHSLYISQLALTPNIVSLFSFLIVTRSQSMSIAESPTESLFAFTHLFKRQERSPSSLISRYFILFHLCLDCFWKNSEYLGAARVLRCAERWARNLLTNCLIPPESPGNCRSVQRDEAQIYGPNDVVLIWLPQYHDMGLVCGYLTSVVP